MKETKKKKLLRQLLRGEGEALEVNEIFLGTISKSCRKHGPVILNKKNSVKFHSLIRSFDLKIFALNDKK